MTSLWLDPATTVHRLTHPPLVPGSRFEVAVIGGGLTGLATALLLARAGTSVALVEARHLAAGTTGNTTAKVSLLQGTKLSQLSARHTTDTVRGYVTANREGQQWLLRYCEDHGIAVERQMAVTYATTEHGAEHVKSEHAAAHSAGLETELLTELPFPFATTAAVGLRDQLQFNPVDVVLEMAGDIARHGGTVCTGTRVRGVSGRGPYRLQLDDGEALAERIVLATGVPMLDRGGYFARLLPLRSYAIALQVPGLLELPMSISADQPRRSLRTAVVEGERRLVVGGAGHVTGRAESTARSYAALEEWAAANFPGARTTHRWSAQDYRCADGLPVVGPLLPGSADILAASGFDKWGMAMSVAAALSIAARMLGEGPPDWAFPLRPFRPGRAAGLDRLLSYNAAVATRLVTDWAQPRVHSSEVVPPEGKGRVELEGACPVAVSTVDGVSSRLSAVCTHLGGILTWNDAERTWDCPLHGSRFAADGEPLEGPATRGLGDADGEPAGTDR